MTFETRLQKYMLARKYWDDRQVINELIAMAIVDAAHDIPIPPTYTGAEHAKGGHATKVRPLSP